MEEDYNINDNIRGNIGPFLSPPTLRVSYEDDGKRYLFRMVGDGAEFERAVEEKKEKKLEQKVKMNWKQTIRYFLFLYNPNPRQKKDIFSEYVPSNYERVFDFCVDSYKIIEKDKRYYINYKKVGENSWI
jgi:hypothetical protein